MSTVSALAGEANHNDTATVTTRTTAIAILAKLKELFRMLPKLIKFCELILILLLILFEVRIIVWARFDLSSCRASGFFNAWAMSGGIFPAKVSNSSLSAFKTSASLDVTCSLGGGAAPLSILLR